LLGMRIARDGLRRLLILKPDHKLIELHIDSSKRVPVIRLTGIHVLSVLSYLVECDWDITQTQEEFPDLSPAQIRAVSAYAETRGGKNLLKQYRRNCRAK